MPSVGVFLRDPTQYLHEFRRKPSKNSEWLGRQARPVIEPGTFHLPVLREQLLGHRWGQLAFEVYCINCPTDVVIITTITTEVTGMHSSRLYPIIST